MFSDDTIARRFVLAFLIVIAILLVLALFGYLSGRWSDAEAKEIDFYQGVAVDAKLLQLDKQALDEAYHTHLIRLWNVWLSDGARGADRISTGLRLARESYRQAAGQIAKREQELQKK